MQDKIDVRKLWTSLRPGRVAILIDVNDKDWIDTCFRIIEWSTMVWGGWYNLIVPTDGDVIEENFWQLLEKFDPDYIYYYKKTYLDLKINHPEEYEGKLNKEVDQFLLENPDRDRDNVYKMIDEQSKDVYIDNFAISPRLNKELKERLNPFHHVHNDNIFFQGRIVAYDDVAYPLTSVSKIAKKFATPNIYKSINNYVFQSSKNVKLLFCSITGIISHKFAEDLDNQGAPYISISNPPLQNIEEILEKTWKEKREILKDLPSSLSLLNLDLYYPFFGVKLKEPFVIVIGDSIRDFCLYYCLSRMEDDVFWIPRVFFDKIEKRSNQKNNNQQEEYIPEYNIIWRLSQWLSTKISYVRSESKIFFTSCSLKKEELEPLKQLLSKLPTISRIRNIKNYIDIKDIKENIDDILPYVMRIYELDNYYNSYLEQFYEGKSLNFIITPKPKSFIHVPPTDHYWISEIGIEGYKLPKRAELGPSTIIPKNYSTLGIRVSRDGLAYFGLKFTFIGGDIDANLFRPRLEILKAFDIFTIIFNSIGLSIKYSDKGNFHLESVRLFDSIDEMSSFLKNKKYKEMMDLYISKKENENLGIYLQSDQRRYLDFNSLNEIIGDEEQTINLRDRLVNKGILLRGFIFKCERCRNASWYNIEYVERTFTCSRCGAKQIYIKKHWFNSSDEPQWFYKLNEVFYQGLINNMHVPVLTIGWLKKGSKESFLYVPEIEIRKDPTSSKPNLEIDFCAATDGEIIIGESTIIGKLAQKRIRQYKHIANSLRANRIIFSTFCESWEDSTKEYVQEIFNGEKIKPILITKSDLLST